jgi:hypothetical protein
MVTRQHSNELWNIERVAKLAHGTSAEDLDGSTPVKQMRPWQQ